MTTKVSRDLNLYRLFLNVNEQISIRGKYQNLDNQNHTITGL